MAPEVFSDLSHYWPKESVRQHPLAWVDGCWLLPSAAVPQIMAATQNPGFKGGRLSRAVNKLRPKVVRRRAFRDSADVQGVSDVSHVA